MALPALAVALSLCACGTLSGLDPFALPVAAVAEAPRVEAPAAPAPDGRYAGFAILTAFHGDCNAGGTGELAVHGRTVTYRDARNPVLSGPLGAHGEVDLVAGPVRLSGRFVDAVFTGRIAGGACEYQMRFERVPD